MIGARRLRLVILPVALVATGGCLATRSDVEQLQLGVGALRDSLHEQQARQVRSDSITRAVIRDVTQQLGEQFIRRFTVLSDSVRTVAAALSRLDGNVTLSMHTLNQQMVAVQEGIGISQKRISELGTKVEAMPAVPPPASPTGGSQPSRGASGSSTPAAPPAAVLWQLGREALNKNATAAAREDRKSVV